MEDKEPKKGKAPDMEPEQQSPDTEEIEIYIPRGSTADEPDLMVGINGKNYLLPKGKSHKVPRAVAEEILRAQKAQEVYDSHVDAFKNQAPVELKK